MNGLPHSETSDTSAINTFFMLVAISSPVIPWQFRQVLNAHQQKRFYDVETITKAHFYTDTATTNCNTP